MTKRTEMRSPEASRDSFPPAVELRGLNTVLVVAGVLSLFSSNPLELAFAILQLKILLHSYWRKNTPPVILLLFIIPWIEISTGIIEANFSGLTLDELLNGYGRSSYWLSALGLTAVHLGFFSFFKNFPSPSIKALQNHTMQVSTPRLIIAYFAISPIAVFLGKSLGRGSTLFQLVTYLDEISIVLLVVICLSEGLKKRVTPTFLGFIFVAFIFSFYSFFSEWRVIAFGLFIGFGLAAQLNAVLIRRILVMSFFLGNVIFLWQGIKPFYRAYLAGQESLAGGLRSQSVTVSREDALLRFFELSQQFYSGELIFDGEKESVNSDDILYSTLQRIGYLEFFTLAQVKVPSELDHEGGKLLKENISFALIPRFLNPNKGVKDDGVKVTKYTGFMVVKSASFSLGHYTEYFIDFGRFGMLIVLFVYGWLGGQLYRLIGRSVWLKAHPLYFYGLAYVVLNEWGSFQNDAIFIYGLTFFGGICHLFVFRPIYRFLDSATQKQKI